MGDLDHLVFYLLQSTGFTTLPPIEPALSAKALVEGLGEPNGKRFCDRRGDSAEAAASAVRDRIGGCCVALGAPTRDPRLIYFGELVTTAFPDRSERETASRRASTCARCGSSTRRSSSLSARPSPADAVADLYRSRGLSTDTAVEAGYLVSIGLGVLKSLEPERRVRRVLIVGPGLDLAPRTALLEPVRRKAISRGRSWTRSSRPASRVRGPRGRGRRHQPTSGRHLRRAHAAPPTLTLVSEIRDSDTVTLL